jgi:predicted Abi (CAAX) family protease
MNNFSKNRKLSFVALLMLVGLAACLALLFTPKPQSISLSDYEITSQAPFNQLSYYPLKQTVNPNLYQPTGTWVGRLILPTQEQLATVSPQDSDWVWLEVYIAPQEAQNLVGQVIRLGWQQDPSKLDYIKLVKTDIHLTEAAINSQRQGNVIPSRLNGYAQVGPLQSLAGARPKDDVLVSLDRVRIAKDDKGKSLLRLEQFPVLVSGRFSALVAILETVPEKGRYAAPKACPGKAPCPSELFRVRHYNRASGEFDGIEEIVRIPQQPALSSGRFPSTPQALAESSVGKAGWYLYGAQDAQGMFTVEAIKPRSLFQLQPTEVVLSEGAGLDYIKRGNWQATEARKGTAQTVLVDSSVTSQEAALANWKEGDYGLVIHLFGGIGGEKGSTPLAGTVTGHFAYGLAQVVRDSFTDELQFEIKYYQVYAHNSQGILSGVQTWANYMGNLQRGWLGGIPVSDVIVKLDALEDYNFGGMILSPLKELRLQLQVMMARYRTGDGTGNSSITPATSCVQDSNQALYIAIEELKRQVKETPAISQWLQEHPKHPQTQRFERLVVLGRILEKTLTPEGVVRPDWKQNAETLAAVKQRVSYPFIKQDTLASGLLSWRSMLPRGGHDTISSIFLRQGAKLWFIRTNQVGGWDPEILPLAPTRLFGEIPVISLVLRRLLAAVVLLPGWQGWLTGLGILLGYGAIALPLGFISGFLRWQPAKVSRGKLLVWLGILFFSPALWEELIFRVVWLPHPAENVPILTWLLWAISGLALFIVYHPFNALLFYKQGKPTFFNPIFLALTGLLGVACTVVYALTASLWEIAVIHWLVVAIWLLGLGGQQKLEGSYS